MVSIIINISEEVNKKIMSYMLNNDLTNKPMAIERILEETKNEY